MFYVELSNVSSIWQLTRRGRLKKPTLSSEKIWELAKSGFEHTKLLMGNLNKYTVRPCAIQLFSRFLSLRSLSIWTKHIA